MDIDFYRELQFNIRRFCYIAKKNKVKKSDVEQLLLIIQDIKDLLDIYLYEYLDN